MELILALNGPCAQNLLAASEAERDCISRARLEAATAARDQRRGATVLLKTDGGREIQPAVYVMVNWRNRTFRVEHYG